MVATQILQAQSEEEKNEWIAHTKELFEDTTSLPTLKAVSQGVLASNRLASSVSTHIGDRSVFSSTASVSSEMGLINESPPIASGRRETRTSSRKQPSLLTQPLIS